MMFLIQTVDNFIYGGFLMILFLQTDSLISMINYENKRFIQLKRIP